MLNSELAKEAYNAYGETTGFKNYMGGDMPAWDYLPVEIKGAWKAATAFLEILIAPGLISFEPALIAFIAPYFYQTYSKFVDDKNSRKQPMPKWEELGDNIQAAWVSALFKIYILAR